MDYLEGKTSKEEVVVFFNFICETSDMRMSFSDVFVLYIIGCFQIGLNTTKKLEKV